MRAEVLQRIEGRLLTSLASRHSLDENRLKQAILSRITSRGTERALRDVRTIFSPSFARMMELRATILERIIDWQPIPIPLWQRAMRPLAVAALFLCVLRLAPIPFLATPIQASSESLLMPTQGTVSLTDGAEWSIVTEELPLTESVTLRTGPESAATIVTRDTIIRLGENAEITLGQAAFDSHVPGPIARLAYGEAWVSGFLPEALLSGITITLPQGTLALKEGSVSILADPQQSTVQVFDRYARVLPTGEEPIHLIQGDQLVLLPDSKTQRHLITPAMQREEWVRENLARDASHRIEIVEKRHHDAETVAGILPDSAFYLLKIASENIDLGLTIGSKARQEKRLQHAATRMNEAVALLKAGKKEEAKLPLEAYKEAIRSLASVSEDEAKALLAETIVLSTSAVSDALPHSDLFIAKEAALETAAETNTAEIAVTDVDLYLLSDALLEIESLVTQGRITEANIAWNGIEGAVASVIDNQRLGEMIIEKDSLKATKTILRSIALSLTQAEEIVQGKQADLLATLRTRIEHLSPLPTPISVASIPQLTGPCMTLQDITRQTNQFLAAVFTYQTSRAQRNAVLQQIALLPDCPESGRVLSKVMNKVPVFTRSFVWEALQKTGTDI